METDGVCIMNVIIFILGKYSSVQQNLRSYLNSVVAESGNYWVPYIAHKLDECYMKPDHEGGDWKIAKDPGI